MTVVYITIYFNDINDWKDERKGRFLKRIGFDNYVNVINPSECTLFVGLTYSDFAC